MVLKSLVNILLKPSFFLSTSESESKSLNTDSLAANPLWRTTLISASLFIGANIKIIAVIKDMNVPTDTTSRNSSEVTKYITMERNKATTN